MTVVEAALPLCRSCCEASQSTASGPYPPEPCVVCDRPAVPMRSSPGAVQETFRVFFERLTMALRRAAQGVSR